MRILIYGELWEGTQADIVSKILKGKNIECKVFDFFSMISYHLPINFANRVLRRLFYAYNEKIINQQLIREIDTFKPDVFLVLKGINIFPETLLAFQRKSIKVVNWNMDDFFNPLNSSIHLKASFGIYDYIFSPRKHLFNQYQSAGMRNLFFSESYYVPWLHKKPEVDLPIERKVSFMGSFSKRREKIIGAIHESFPVEIWGAGWGLSSLRTKKNILVQNKVMLQKDFPEMISKSLVNLNNLTIENNDLTNLKVFEVTACFGLLLTDYNQYTESFLQDGGLYYNPDSAAELNEKLAFIFDPSNTDRVEYIRQRGYSLITNGHNTINDRVDDVIDVLSK